MPPAVRRKLLLLFSACAFALAAAGSAAAANGGFTPETAHSPNAHKINSAYLLILILTSVIFVLVEGALIAFIVKYRSRGRSKAVEGQQIHGHARAELIWTVIPVLILAAIASFVFYELPGIRDVPKATAADPQVHIQVEGRQFYWQFTYPNGAVSIDELHVPVGETVVLDVISRDVIHSWWIPELGGKFDAIPGKVNHTWFRVDRAGTYTGACAELCGLQHAAMVASVVAVAPADYDAWVAQRKSQLAAAAFGKEEANGVCAKCHYFKTGDGVLVGPNLAGNSTLTDVNSLSTLVHNGSGKMPAVGKYWNDDQVAALVAYFKGGASGG